MTDETLPQPIPPTQPPQEHQVLLDVITRIIGDESVSIERLERVLAMRLQIIQDQRRQDFNAALLKVQRAIPQVVKNRANDQTHSVYATLDAIGEAIDNIVTESGLTLTFAPGDGAPANTVRIVATLAHVGGFERQYTADIPLDLTGPGGKVNKTQTHAWGSAATYGRRYLTMMIFNVKVRNDPSDDDGNAASPTSGRTISAQQVADLAVLGECLQSCLGHRVDGEGGGESLDVKHIGGFGVLGAGAGP